MLTRIAGNCFWMSRYLERAENNARLLRMAERHACMPETADDPVGLWSTALEVGGSLDDYVARIGAIAPDAVTRFMVLDRQNPSGIVACIRNARDNARTARHLLPDVLWDTTNGTWIEAQALDEARIAEMATDGVVSWTLTRCRMIDGCMSELWRDTVPHVIGLGRSIERADFIARILAEMLPKLLAQGCTVPRMGTADCRRWKSLLEGLGLGESWRRTNAGVLDPLKVLELVLLHPTAPHGMLVNVRAMAEAIRGFAPGREGAALDTARAIEAKLVSTDLQAVAGPSMDQFCRQLTALTNQLGAEVQRDHFA
ncbi:MAG: alpha-E domain-containing protein [Planctomycetes bacterium]|nr:alpha-E domain-containing protein [Planctomycetota bacterium]